MFFKLALGNVRKSARDFAIYFVTLALGVAVFYAFNTISGQADFLDTGTQGVLESLAYVMRGVTVFLAAIMGFLMVYANNYLVRRRKRELGLYQLLGMRRGQVSLVLVTETLIASIGSYVAGLAGGVLLSQLMVFLTASIFQAKITDFQFRFSPDAAVFTLECFAVIFLIMLIMNLRTLRKVRLSDLMGAERANEQVKVRSLPVTIVLGIAGAALIGVAYWRLVRDGIPVQGGEQYGAFGITTAMVTVGTFAFFYALSGVLLHVGKALRGSYYKGLNMFTLRQLAARVNTVSVSMAIVSLILFLAITSTSTGMAIVAMVNKGIALNVPYDASVYVLYNYADDDATQEPLDIQKALGEKGIDLSPVVADSATRTTYSYRSVEGGDGLGYHALSQETGIEIPKTVRNMFDAGTVGVDEDGNATDYVPVVLTSATDYNASRKMLGMDPVDLDGSYLFACTGGGDMVSFYEDVMKAGTTLTLASQSLKPSATGFDSSATATLYDYSLTSGVIITSGVITMVVPDSVVAGARPSEASLNVMYSVDAEKGDAFMEKNLPHGFDSDSMIYLHGEPEATRTVAANTYVRTTEAAEGVGLAGLVAYLAIYIGFVLVVACAAILAIQQLSSASDAAPSYLLLSELGAPKSMAMGSLMRQVLAFFALPLVVAVAHSAVALTQVLHLVKLFVAGDVVSTTFVAAAVFALVYAAYFVVTYQMARGIVSVRAQR